MIRWAAWGLLALSGCTSVRLVQREGCWVKRTERWGQVVEELGPCLAPSAPPAEDRWSRAVQECVARADHRWQMQAQVAWSRGQPLPAPGPEDGAYRACLEEPAKALAGDNELLRRKNEDAEHRLAEVAHERDELRDRVEAERRRREAGEGERLAAEQRMTDRLLTAQEKVGDRLFHGQDTLATYLGEAAKKSSPPAVATATSTSRSDGSATTESAATSPAAGAPAARVRPAPARTARREAACSPVADAGAARQRAGQGSAACPAPAAQVEATRPEPAVSEERATARGSTGSPRAEASPPRAETGSPRAETGSPRAETGSPRAETTSRRPEAGPPGAETGSPRAALTVPEPPGPTGSAATPGAAP